ncbi:hypothetical protein [Streptomyces mordarskii]|uniref:Uncharacterized protein n=1 Tax=Streptomyces mordarskii TaxID=1226758 RepID=A0ABN1EVR2_9ACTN
MFALMARRLARWAAGRLGEPAAIERYREEWAAELTELPGKWVRLFHAVSYVIYLPQTRKAVRASEVQEERLTIVVSKTAIAREASANHVVAKLTEAGWSGGVYVLAEGLNMHTVHESLKTVGRRVLMIDVQALLVQGAQTRGWDVILTDLARDWGMVLIDGAGADDLQRLRQLRVPCPVLVSCPAAAGAGMPETHRIRWMENDPDFQQLMSFQEMDIGGYYDEASGEMRFHSRVNITWN